MKRPNVEIIKNFLRKLSENELDFIASRLFDQYGGDVANVTEFLQKNSEIDKILQTDCIDSFYEVLDAVKEFTVVELRRRSQYHKN